MSVGHAKKRRSFFNPESKKRGGINIRPYVGGSIEKKSKKDFLGKAWDPLNAGLIYPGGGKRRGASERGDIGDSLKAEAPMILDQKRPMQDASLRPRKKVIPSVCFSWHENYEFSFF